MTDFINLEQWSGSGSVVLIHDTMPLQVSLMTVGEVDAAVVRWLQRAYWENS